MNRVIDRAGIDTLMTSLAEDGFTVIGPTVRDNAVVYDTVRSTDDLPVGAGDAQDGGEYRLTERGDGALFGYNLGPTTWRRFLNEPKTELLRIRRSESGFEATPTPQAPPRHAFFGVRACELAAIAVQDRVLMGPHATDPAYASRREGLLIVAVNCGTAAATCFCASMGTGPRVGPGADLLLTEIEAGDGLEYLIESGSKRGADIAEALPGREVTDADLATADSLLKATEESMVRAMGADGIRDFLVGAPDHPRWDDIAARCLACGGCTLACPTCFCSTTVDSVTLDGEAVRSSVWDSCFSLDFTSLHGHAVRGSTKSRYRQWLTHKLATWHDQFGTSGCVGCGRCITWCPVGIDMTEEVAAMRKAVPA